MGIDCPRLLTLQRSTIWGGTSLDKQNFNISYPRRVLFSHQVSDAVPLYGLQKFCEIESWNDHQGYLQRSDISARNNMTK